jgi:sugar-specific transcriptional regulator TrmB
MENKSEMAQEERKRFQQQEMAYLNEIDTLRQQIKKESEHYEVSQNGLSTTVTRIITCCEESKILCCALTLLHEMFMILRHESEN